MGWGNSLVRVVTGWLVTRYKGKGSQQQILNVLSAAPSRSLPKFPLCFVLTTSSFLPLLHGD